MAKAKHQGLVMSATAKYVSVIVGFDSILLNTAAQSLHTISPHHKIFDLH